MKHWWKYLSVLLLLYVIVYSLYIPLGPGIQSVNKSDLQVGDNNEIHVYGYNTGFPTNHHVGVWIKSGEFKLCADQVKVFSSNDLAFNLTLPEKLPSKSLTLFIEYKNGYLVYENAFHVNNVQSGIPDSSTCVSKYLYNNSNSKYFPNRNILNETIRNLMFHVPMWFVMMLLMTISVVYSIKFLSGFDTKYDLIAKNCVNVGIVFALLGLITGSLWAKFTWGQWWISDAKLNGAAITTLIYFAYQILRNSIAEEQNRARVAAVYNIFAYVILIVMLMVLPRMTDSLHPGNGGNPAFSQYDLDNNLRAVFYPAVLGWMGLSLWLLQIRIRLARLQEKIELK